MSKVFAFLIEKGVSSFFYIFSMPHPFIDIDFKRYLKTSIQNFNYHLLSKSKLVFTI
jgi:hypothetical protein